MRSIRDNIGQLIIVILTVTVVSMLFFVTLTIGDLFVNLQTSIKARLGKDADFTVSATVFSESELDEFLSGREDVDFVEKYLQTAGLYKPASGSYSKVVMIEATDLRGYADRHGKELVVYDSYEYSYDCPEAWVGRSFAEENGIKAGDTIDVYLEMYKTYRTLTVSYVFENYGIFANNVVNNVIADFSTIGNKGLISTANVALKEGADKEKFLAEATEYFGDDATVAESVDYAEIYRIAESNKRLLRIALVFVTALMIFILYTSFLVVAKKRINELIVFKTVGATNGQIAGTLIFEGAFYGFTGAVLGTVLGRIGMGIAVNKVIPNFPDAVSFGATDYVLSVLFGMAVSTISAVFPVLKAGKESVRTATGDKAKAIKKKSFVPLVASAVVLSVAAVLTAVFRGNVISVVFLVLCAGAFTYFVTPYLIRGVSSLFRRRGIIRLSGLTVKRNPSGNTLSGMVGSIMVFAFAVVSIVDVIIGAVTPKNARYEADFVVDSIVATDMNSIAREMSEVYGVDRAYMYVWDTFVWNKDNVNREFTVYGVDDSKALSGICPELSAEDAEAFDAALHPVIITYDLANRFHLKKGDSVTLTLASGNGDKRLYDEFCVVGIDMTVTADDRIMAIRKEDFRVDGKAYLPDENMLFLYTRKDVPAEDLYRDLRDKAEKNSCYILGMEDWAYATSVGITGIKTLLIILQIAVGVVALVGVINLTAVTVMSREREFEIFKACGLDENNYALLGLLEGLIISLTGTSIGIALSVIVNVILPDFAKIIDRYVYYYVFPWQLAVIGGAFILAYSAVYCITALLGRKKGAVERNTL